MMTLHITWIEKQKNTREQLFGEVLLIQNFGLNPLLHSKAILFPTC